jgi:hypothetical protein
MRITASHIVMPFFSMEVGLLLIYAGIGAGWGLV